MQIARSDIEVEVREEHEPWGKPRARLTLHKPDWPGVWFQTGWMRSAKDAHETKAALVQWLREIGIEVTE